MIDMHSFDKIKKMLCAALNDIADNEDTLTVTSLEQIDKLLHSLKSIESIEHMHGKADKVEETSEKSVMAKKLAKLQDEAETSECKDMIKSWIDSIEQ